MPEYRIYFIGTDGHFFKAEQLLSSDDPTAIEATKQFIDGYDLELWQGDRKITAFPAEQVRIISPLSASSLKRPS